MEKIGEIDTKPIESVLAGISLFGARSDLNKFKPTGNNGYEKERELEEVVKDLANYKVQLEAKDAAYMQALLKMEQQQKTIHDLSELLKIAEADRDKYIYECSEARTRLGELEHKLNEMTDQSMETEKVREQLEAATNELKIKQEELLGVETELAASRESEVNGIVKIELLETNARLEKEKTVDLTRHISELNEAIRTSKLVSSEAEKEMSAVLSAKDAELELAMEKVVELQRKLEEMHKQTELMHDLESQLLAKTLYIDMLESGLKQTNELESSCEKTSFDDLSNHKQIKVDLAVMDREFSDRALYIESLKMERNQLKEEIKNANEEIEKFKDEIEPLKNQLERMKLEMDEAKEKESNAEVEMALLKSELHKGRSKVAASETAESKAESVRSGLADPTSELSADNFCELEKLKKELEAAMIRIGEFRSRAEQAATRAEMAEKAKEAVEEQLRKWREHKQRRKAALAAMKEASEPPKFKPPMSEGNSKVYQPLGKVLNLKL